MIRKHRETHEELILEELANGVEKLGTGDLTEENILLLTTHIAGKYRIKDPETINDVAEQICIMCHIKEPEIEIKENTIVYSTEMGLNR